MGSKISETGPWQAPKQILIIPFSVDGFLRKWMVSFQVKSARLEKKSRIKKIALLKCSVI